MQPVIRNSVSLVSPQQLLLTFVPPGDHLPASNINTTTSGAKKRRTRVVWGASETHLLLEIWGPRFEQIRSGSIAVKRDLWREVLYEFENACIKNKLTVMSLDQLRKRIANLEYKYRQVKAKLCIADDKETEKLRADFPFYDALDTVLGENANTIVNHEPDHESPPPESSSSCRFIQDDFKTDEGDLSMAVNHHESLHDQPAVETSIAVSQDKNMKRKRGFSVDDEEPYVKQMCELWKTSLQRQEEWFNRIIEMQERILTNQTAQMKTLVDSLRDMMAELINAT